MKNIETRLQEYEKKLIDTMNGYLKSLETEKDIEKIQNFKHHVEHIQKIFSFGTKEYLALNSLVNINYYAENYRNMSIGLKDSYARCFGLENSKEMDELLYNAFSGDDIRNVIWKECMGMEYDLLSKGDVSIQIKELQGNANMNNEEKREKITELICKSGYNGSGLSNPIYLDGGLEYLEPIMENIKKENSKTI